jgi:exosortase
MTSKQKPLPGLQAPGWLLPGSLLLVAWALAIRQLSLEWTINPEYQYGWIVPFLTLLLWRQAWSRRPEAGDHTASRALPGLVALLVVFGLPIRVIAEANPDWRPLNYYYTGQAILITALIVDYTGGRAWLRHFAFPLLFPLVAVPWPSSIESVIIQDLQRCIASLGVEGASWMGWSAFQQGSLIVLSQGIVGLNEACSGIRSLQASLMLALFLGAYFQMTTLKRWFLLALALFLAFVLNVARAFLLIAVMQWHGVSMVSKFHDPAGFGIAAVSLLLLWIVSSFLSAPEAPVVTPSRRTAGAFGFPARWSVILLAAWFGTEALNQAWYLWHERNTVPGPLWTLKWPPPRPGFKDEKIADEVQIYLQYNEGMHGEWNDPSHWEVYFFTWKPGRAAAGLARFHHPDICLPASGYTMKEQLAVKNIRVNGLDLPMTSYVFQDPLSGHLFYVFQVVTDDRVGNHAVEWENGAVDSSFRLQAAWDGWRNPGQRSLLVLNQGAGSLEEAELGVQSLLSDSLVIAGKSRSHP